MKIILVLTFVLITTDLVQAQGTDTPAPPAVASQALPAADSAGRGIQILLSSVGLGRDMLYGRVPPIYRILNLTPEQTKAVEGVCIEARNDRSRLLKGLQGTGRPMDRDLFRKLAEDRQKKEDEIVSRHEARIAGLLTPPQKALLEKIESVSEQKIQEEKKLANDFRLAREKMIDKYEKEMAAVLTPEQIKKLDKAAGEPRSSRLMRHDRH